jgi:1-acyl-sn-glycerol-3-phosphate acyltransferase
MIRTAIVALLLGLYTIIAGPPLLLHAWITSDPDLLYRAGVSGAVFVGRLVGLRITVEGREKIPSRACLFLANHTSFVDPVPIVSAIPRRVGILAKKSLFSVPIIGWAFRLAKFVPVDRAHHGEAVASVDAAAERIRQGMSFLAYPEGTRSYDGRLLPFKRGVFVLAIKAGVPIVPMVSVGTQLIAPKGSLSVKPGHVLVRFGEPIEMTGYTMDRRNALLERVHAAMTALLPPDQQPLHAGSAGSKVNPESS